MPNIGLRTAEVNGHLKTVATLTQSCPAAAPVLGELERFLTKLAPCA